MAAKNECDSCGMEVFDEFSQFSIGNNFNALIICDICLEQIRLESPTLVRAEDNGRLVVTARAAQRSARQQEVEERTRSEESNGDSL